MKNVPSSPAESYHLPPPPEHITGVAAEKWATIGAVLGNQGKLAECLEILELYCISYATWRDATEHVETEGAVIECRNGLKRNPWAHQQEKMAMRCTALLAQMKLSDGAGKVLRANEANPAPDILERLGARAN